MTKGERLGPYETLDAIGAGGMGEVWKARDTRLDRIAAIKTSKEGFPGSRSVVTASRGNIGSFLRFDATRTSLSWVLSCATDHVSEYLRTSGKGAELAGRIITSTLSPLCL
jgi:serine/threonine protein kinase